MAFLFPLAVKSYIKEDPIGLYRRQGCGLTQVPTDIPASTAKVNLKTITSAIFPLQCFLTSPSVLYSGI